MSAPLVSHPALEESSIDPSLSANAPEQAAPRSLPPLSAELDDAGLMAHVKAGSGEAFGLVMDRYRDALVNYLIRLTRSRERAEEIAQEAFFRLFRSVDKYREQGHLAAYLYRIATNQLRSEERRSKRWRELLPTFKVGQPLYTDSPHGAAASHEVVEVVSAALGKLPLKYRAPIALREIEGWSYREIAAAMECREGTIKSRINRGKAMLRTELSSFWNSGEGR